jgi:hypothetical protein
MSGIMKTPEILLVWIFVSLCSVSGVVGQEVSHAAFAELSKEQQLQILRENVERFQSVAKGKMVDASYSISDRGITPLNYGNASPTEGLQWGPVQRRIKYRLRYDGKYGWDRAISTSARELENWDKEHGQNGSKAVWIGREMRHGSMAVINCGQQIADTPDLLWAQPIKYLYYHESHAAASTLLLEVLDNATSINTDVQFASQQAVAVTATGRPGIDRLYFAIEPSVRCIGIEREPNIPPSAIQGGKYVHRLEFQYSPVGGSLELKQAIVAYVHTGVNGRTYVDPYREFTIDRLRFTEPLAADAYLPKIPAGMKVRDNCAARPVQSVAAAAVEQPKSLLWLYMLVGLLSCVLVVGGVLMWRRQRA